MPEWLIEGWSFIKDRETLFTWIGGISLSILIVSAIAVPIIIGRMPHDYFLESSETAEEIREQHPALRIAFLVLKNLIGGTLVLGGILMIITPGQGILTIMIGLLLMNFPGKHHFEIWLIRLGPLNRAIQWMRKRAGKRPLQLPEPEPSSPS